MRVWVLALLAVTLAVTVDAGGRFGHWRSRSRSFSRSRSGEFGNPFIRGGPLRT